MKTNTYCTLCNSNTATLQISQHKGYKEPDLFDIYYCSSCNTSFAMPVTYNTKVLYELIYKNSSIIPGYDRYYKYAELVLKTKYPFNFLAKQEPAYWSIWHAITQKIKPNKTAKILEVGSGLGYLTYALQQGGFSNTLGLDISTQAIQNAKEKYGNYYICEDVEEFTKNNQCCFEIIILTEVIEHLSNPIQFITCLLALLKPNGVILLTTPNKSFYPKDTIWQTDPPPVHFWWMSEDSIQFICKKLNVPISFIKFNTYYLLRSRRIIKEKNNSSYNTFRFDLNNNPIKKNYPPPTLKKQIKNTLLYNLMAKIFLDFLFCLSFLLPKYFYISGKKTDILCAMIKKI